MRLPSLARSLVAPLALVSLTSLGGCGALASLREPRRPFGGVAYHVAAIRGELGCHDLFMPAGAAYWLWCPFTLPGLVSAATLDVLLLPFAPRPGDEAPGDEERDPPPRQPPRPRPILRWTATAEDPPPPAPPPGVDAGPCGACAFPVRGDWHQCPRCGTDVWPPVR